MVHGTVQDGDNSPDSRWSCSPTVGEGGEGVCVAQFDLNTNKNIRQIQLGEQGVVVAPGDKDARHSNYRTKALVGVCRIGLEL